MNENLRKLANDSGFMTFRTGKFTEEQAIEKFTETIIKQCAYVMSVNDQEKRKEIEELLIKKIK